MKTQATLDDLVDQVGNLTSATTDLLNATNLGKVNLDSAVSEAQGHAQSAELASNDAVNAKEVAISKAAEAKTAADNATAIVHNDEGSLTSKPGAYPVADSKGHLDINWTPLLAAMYPYSGVIGSVDKNDLFQFAAVAEHANQFGLSSGKAFNINGRFVKTTAWTVVKCTEAESTAARAIAFDDIFLDWNGQVQTYRSITPYPVGASHDRDAIATEHGYSKIQKGLYKTGDTYALLLGRVTRRNKGAYHPAFNLEGAASYWTTDVQWGGGNWNQTVSAGFITSKDSCFDMKGTPDKVAGAPFAGSGNIAAGQSSQGYLGRPDKKPYDAIYADDFTPLYYSAKNVIDRQALLFDSFNRAVAGETFSGAEGLNEYCMEVINTAHHPTWNMSTIQLKSPLYKGWGADDVIVTLMNGSTYSRGGTNGNRFDLEANQIEVTGDITSKLTTGDRVFVRGKYQNTQYYTIASSARPQFLMVDIIGSLDAMPDEWKTHGIPGNWLAVGEEGESLIPDGTQKNFKLSRKCLECYQVLKTYDKGITWSDITSTFKPSFDGAGNSVSAGLAANECWMVFYRTSANPFELTSSVGAMIAVGDAHFNAMSTASNGSVFVSHILNKVSTGDATTKQFYSVPLDSVSFVPDYRGLWKSGQFAPTHPANTLGVTTSPAVKVFPVLQGSLNSMTVFYKELKHNGTSWGDDNKFNIVDKQSTATDLNGESVIVGQKRVELPYQFDGVTY